MAKILIIDDCDSQRAATRAAVESSGLFKEILEARDGLAGLKLLLGEEVDLVLCDLEMPHLEGEKLLRLKASGSGLASVPFLFLTGSSNQERRARLLEDGACDAISKPFHPAELVARLRLHLRIKRLQEELLIKNATLARLSTVDALTGLRTRRYVQEVLTVDFLRARRYGAPLTVCMIDVDHFKSINDQFGHPGGDAVLERIGAMLAEGTRSTDVCGRYGGEELIVVMHQNSARGADLWANGWRERVAAEVFTMPDGREARITVSMGLAEYSRGHQSPEDLVAAADAALYAAKTSGRNRVVVG